MQDLSEKQITAIQRSFLKIIDSANGVSFEKAARELAMLYQMPYKQILEIIS